VRAHLMLFSGMLVRLFPVRSLCVVTSHVWSCKPICFAVDRLLLRDTQHGFLHAGVYRWCVVSVLKLGSSSIPSGHLLPGTTSILVCNRKCMFHRSVFLPEMRD
jgi:hypothetical protein